MRFTDSSYRWLFAHGQEDEAIKILADLEDKPINDPYIVAEREEIVFSIEYERQNAINWGDLLRGRTKSGTKTIRRLILGSGTQAMQQFGGINGTYKKASYSESEAYFIQMLTMR